jgi:hypothetical protein
MKPALVARMNGQVDCGDFRWNVTPGWFVDVRS